MDNTRFAPSTVPRGHRALEIAQGPDHQHAIEQSHARCRAMGLRELAHPEPVLVSAALERQMLDQHHRLLAHATPVMEMLFEQIVFTKSIVALADAQGNTLQAVGDNAFLERIQQLSRAPSINWAESSRGTNAVGTALFTEAPTLVHGSEHYLRANHFLSCSASPIFDHTGQLMGVLDVSGHQQSYHPHTLAMVTMSARMIENQWFSDKFRHDLRLHFHRRGELLGTMREAMVALSPEGAILGANRSALEQLGLNVAALRKLGLEAVLGVSVAAIADHCRHHADVPMRLFPQHGNLAGEPVHACAFFNWRTIWPAAESAQGTTTAPAFAASGPTAPRLAAQAPQAIATPPTPMPTQTPTPMPTTLQMQELAAIRSAVDAAGGNISLAARQLGVARNTVYRKLRQARAQRCTDRVD